MAKVAKGEGLAANNVLDIEASEAGGGNRVVVLSFGHAPHRLSYNDSLEACSNSEPLSRSNPRSLAFVQNGHWAGCLIVRRRVCNPVQVRGTSWTERIRQTRVYWLGIRFVDGAANDLSIRSPPPA